MIPYIQAGLRMLARRRAPFRQFFGDDKIICRQIIRECFNGTYFQTSIGHFKEFYMRDFGICCKALIRLGYREQVRMTLDWALQNYKKAGKITTTITPSGKAVDFFSQAVDSYAFLFKSLYELGDNQLVSKYKTFLLDQIVDFHDMVVDPQTKLVRSDRFFSSMRDNYNRQSSCYDNSMLAMAVHYINKLKLPHSFGNINYQKRILDKYWTGSYFVDDLSKTAIHSGDAQVFPFYCGVIDDKKKFQLCLVEMRKRNLDDPFPLRYSHIRQPQKEHTISFLAPNYEGDVVWLHLGLCFLQVCKKYDKRSFKHYKEKYKKIILQYKTFPEVFTKDEKPYKSLLYQCDEGMLWASLYLDL